MAKLPEVCAMCGSKEIEKIADDEIYCPTCDVTYKVKDGKTVKASGVSKLDILGSNLKSISEDVEKMKKAIFDIDEEDDFFGLEPREENK